MENTEDRAHTIFISHIHPEQAVARVLKHYISAAFQSHIHVFVSSDGTSISGGEQWFNQTITTLRKSSVVLVLLSTESKNRPWINFEAGFGVGVNALVLPVAMSSFNFRSLEAPLNEFNGRIIDDIDGIIWDISQKIGTVSIPPDRLLYQDAIRNAEAAVIYRSVILRPRIERIDNSTDSILTFDIENQGNVDIDLLHVDVWVPVLLRDRSAWLPGNSPDNPLIWEEVKLPNANCNYYKMRLTALSSSPEKLEPVLTPSMGKVNLSPLKIPLVREINAIPKEASIVYHIHARNYRSERIEQKWGNIVNGIPEPQ